MTFSLTREPFVVGVIDSGIHSDHPHIEQTIRGVGFGRDGKRRDDSMDRLGHGTAVGAAIQDLMPDVQLCALKVFDQDYSTSVEALVAAIGWASTHAIPLVNLSLGTKDPSSAGMLTDAIARAHDVGTVIVAAGSSQGVDWLPGTLCLDGVVRVELDWSCARDSYAVSVLPGCSIFRTCGYPRSIPGVDRERNLKGLSFAVANITGLAARVMIETGVRAYAPLVEELRQRAS